MKCLIAFLLIVFCSTHSDAQIKWDEKRTLTWKDFSAPVNDASMHYANTATSTNYQYHLHYHNNTYTLTFEVECVFLPTASWCKPYKQTDTLLRHEQLHFDIQEIFARKLMVAFKAKTYTANYTNEIKAIFDSVANKASDMQDQYDQSTNFSEIKGEQLKWENLVHQQLQETAAIGKLF